MPSGSSTPRPRFTQPVGDPRDARGLYAAMRRFLEHRGITGSTESSLYNLERYIRDFIAWADARSVTHPEHVSQAVLERYQRHLYYYRKKDGAALSIASRRAKIVPLRSFFKWLTRAGHIPANPASELDLPKSLRRLPRHERPHRLDYAGGALIVLATISLLLALSWGGNRYPWGSTPILALLGGAAGLSVAYHAKPAVRAQAMVAINSGGLDRLLEVLQP